MNYFFAMNFPEILSYVQACLGHTATSAQLFIEKSRFRARELLIRCVYIYSHAIQIVLRADRSISDTA